MKWILITSILFLSACAQEGTVPLFPDPVPDQIMASESNGLSLALVDDSFAGSPSAIRVMLANKSGQPAEYGGYFTIEMKQNGQWFALNHSDAIFYSDPGFRDFGKLLEDGQNVQQSYSIASLGEVLVPGEYRLVKTFLVAEPSYQEVTIAAPFDVK